MKISEVKTIEDCSEFCKESYCSRRNCPIFDNCHEAFAHWQKTAHPDFYNKKFSLILSHNRKEKLKKLLDK